MTTGIYIIIVKGVYAYVGQSINIHSRLEQHKHLILKKKHSNFEIIGDYSIDDCEFKIVCECLPSELNEMEKSVYKKYSSKFIMLNKRECGLQKDPNYRIIFIDDDIPSLEYKNNHFFIDGSQVEVDETGMHCLTDLLLYIRNNSNFNIKPNSILNKDSFINKLNALSRVEIPKDRNTSKHLKDAGLYKVKGTRDTKKIFCDFNTFITFAYESCPQLSASICMMIGNVIKK